MTDNPTPNDIALLREAAANALMYLQTGFVECERCGHEVPTAYLDAAYALADVVKPAPEDATDKEAGEVPAGAAFQQRVQPWLMETFGELIAGDREERNHRFLEEALELVQAQGCTAGEAHQLVDYVFGRPIGEPHQEVGGVMVTLAALCLASGLDMHEAAETELTRIWGKVAEIRAKQAGKPKHSPLPQALERQLVAAAGGKEGGK